MFFKIIDKSVSIWYTVFINIDNSNKFIGVEYHGYNEILIFP